MIFEGWLYFWLLDIRKAGEYLNLDGLWADAVIATSETNRIIACAA